MPRQTNYLEELEKIAEDLAKLNATPPSEQYNEQISTLFTRLKEADQTFLYNEMDITIQSQLLFSRHGQCSMKHKLFGFYPNTGLEESALKNMAETSKYTKSLLWSNELSRVFISPLLRAKETAIKLMPEASRARITVTPTLSESSFNPSGKNITSYGSFFKQFKYIYKSPITLLFFFLSSLIYPIVDLVRRLCRKPTLFETTRQKLTEVDDVLREHQTTNAENLDSAEKPRLKSGEKTRLTQQLMLDSLQENQDTWLFGHGQNLRKLLKTTFGFTERFDYGETKKVYLCKTADGSDKLFCPPYRIRINQKSGRPELALAKHYSLVPVSGNGKTIGKANPKSIPTPNKNEGNNTDLLYNPS